MTDSRRWRRRARTGGAFVDLRSAGLFGWLAAATLLGACSDSATPTAPGHPAPIDGAVELRLERSDTFVFDAGGRSPAPLRVQALVDGTPLVGGRVGFALPGTLGRPSQPEALTDSAGWAETWVLGARPGLGAMTARLGSAMVDAPIRIRRIPGGVTFQSGSGAVGVPGLPHPDSLLRARVVDTEGLPMAGQEVLFAWSGQLRVGRDTTDADGFATGLLGPSTLAAGPNPVFALVSGRNIPAAVSQRRTSPVARRVVLVSIEGLRADALSIPGTPALAELATRGALGIARSVEPTFSVPAHLSLMAGVGPASHGIFSEELEFTPEMNRLDPIFRMGLRQDRGTAAVLSALGHLARFDDLLECRLAFGFDRLSTVGGRSDAVVDLGLDLVADSTIDMLFLHLPDPDLAGHADGWTSPAYAEAVRAADTALGRLLDALPADALLVVVAGHGGGGSFGEFQHGSGAPEDLLVPLFLVGPGVRPGSSLEGADLLDIAPTLGWALGWAPPPSHEGRVLLDPFGSAPASGTPPAGSGPF